MDLIWNRLYPAEVAVKSSELERGIENLVFVEDVTFVIWNWEWVDECYGYESDTESSSIQIIPETPPPSVESDEDETSVVDAVALDVCPQVTHTVTFKCMGTTKENRYQECLAKISKLRDRGIEVPSRVKTEPSNPVDSKAIAFECQIDGTYVAYYWLCGSRGTG